MAWLAVDKDGEECISECEPERQGYVDNAPCFWADTSIVRLPEGSIKRLIGRSLSWEDEPEEFNEVIE